MGGDYTRFTFDPVKGFSGVHKQQGRVSLDSDFNELEEILDRRDRAEQYDTVGQAVVPITTPHGFEIGVNGAGKLTIGQGRMYIDGILAECFGDTSDPTKEKFDSNIGGLVGDDALAALVFDKQPFFYSPNFPSLSPIAGTIDLVYLDVWQREVTVFEDYALREPALNGPDTDTRVQTAWQVKVMQGADATSCAMPPAAFTNLTLPSTGRLTTQATPAAPAPGPCVINPAGGYTGLENRLYRVEIQKAGTLGGGGGSPKAQFKWSRDNASLAAKVVSTTKIALTDWIITVSSTGRDSWMRFEVGNHVELIDDGVEFAMRESGTGGILARITSVNHATGEIHVDQDLSLLPIVAGRHPRIRRWDIASAAEAFTRDATNGVAIALENGITITFGPGAGDSLHAGDFWVFAARTADGTIDTLVSAPPRGILHHFAKLALVTSGAPPTVLTDCRIFWPPPMTAHEGCCSQVVKVGEDIQKAIDKLNGIGGCVCLKMGVHKIKRPLHIGQANVTIHGEVPWVTIQLVEGGPLMLDIGATENVSVEAILFETLNTKNNEPVIRVAGVNGGRIADCGIQIRREKADPSAQAIGIELLRCRGYGIECVEMQDMPFGVIGRESREIGVMDCRLEGPEAKLPTGVAVSLGWMGIQFDAERSVEGIDIERNILTNYVRGIQLGDVSAVALGLAGGSGQPVNTSLTQAGCRIASNVIARHAPPPLFFGAGGIVPIYFAIATHVARCEILENATNIETLDECGILCAGGDTLVARNEVLSNADFELGKPLTQIPFGVLALVTLSDTVACTLRGNRFTGVQQAVFAAGASGFANRVDVLENRIIGSEKLRQAFRNSVAASGSSPIVQLLLLERFSAISLVLVSHSRIADNEIDTTPCGVFAMAANGTSAIGNRVNRSIAGVVMAIIAECEASDNVIDASLEGAPTIGVSMLGAQGSVIERNAISNVADGILTALTTGVRVQDNDVYSAGNGIESLIDVDLELRGNTVEDARTVGIRAFFALHEITVAHCRASRSGYRSSGFPTAPAAGIEVIGAIALVSIDSCHVIDTGESPNDAAPVFTGPRYGIVVLFAIATRVHGCTVASKPLVGNAKANPDSRAIRTWTLTPLIVQSILPAVGSSMTIFADITDNVVEQAVEILTETIAIGEVMFATNRCINFADRPHSPVVLLTGTHITLTGNRIKHVRPAPSLFAVFDQALSAVGNITTSIAVLVPLGAAVQVPAPYPSFNALA